MKARSRSQPATMLLTSVTSGPRLAEARRTSAKLSGLVPRKRLARRRTRLRRRRSRERWRIARGERIVQGIVYARIELFAPAGTEDAALWHPHGGKTGAGGQRQARPSCAGDVLHGQLPCRSRAHDPTGWSVGD